MTMTDERELLDGDWNGKGFSIQTWEQACAESQAWADKERRRVTIRRDRRRAYMVMALLLIVTIALLVIVDQA
jgi:hypothetical protein